MSKGAVLYHFKTKDALIAELVRSSLDQFDAAADAVALRDAGQAGSYVRAYAKVSFNSRTNTNEAASGLLAAVTNNVDLLEPAVKRHSAVQQRFEDDGIPPTLATLIRLAADGLYFTRAFGLAPPTDAQAAKVLALILDLIADTPPNRKEKVPP